MRKRKAELSTPPQWVDLFNGTNLTHWIDVNTSADTWTAENGILKCTDRPIGVMRSEKQYENFILEIEWRHMKKRGYLCLESEGSPVEFRNIRTTEYTEYTELIRFAFLPCIRCIPWFIQYPSN